MLLTCVVLQFNVELYRLKQVCKFDVRRRGTNKISQTEFENSMRYCGEMKEKSCDVTIITGEFDDDPTIQLLLLMRFHKVDPTKMLSSNQMEKLYETIQNLCGKNGFEYKRTGGSSCTLEVSKDFLSFTTNKGTFPRSSSSIKFVKNKSALKWDCYYIGVHPQTVKKISYSNIKKGGSFRMPVEMMSSCFFLQEFLSTKCKAALILHELNATDMNIQVQPNAVRQEISNLKRAQAFDYDFLLREIGNKKEDFIPKREYIMRYLSTMHRHTLVQHPVGFHVDLIIGQPVLENKACFMLKSRNGDTGRGGSGPNTFVFALLDWPKRNETRRSVYRALNGHRIISETVTDWNWNSFVGMTRIQDIPRNKK